MADSRRRPCAPGETGRVLLTALRNFATPFVRYDVGDEAEVGAVPCPCGRGLPLLKRVHGRRRPPFLLPNGRRKNSAELVIGVRRVGGYRQHQIVHRATDDVLVRIVPGPEWTAERADAIRLAVRAFFEAPIHVDVQTVQRIERSPGVKLRDLIDQSLRLAGSPASLPR